MDGSRADKPLHLIDAPVTTFGFMGLSLVFGVYPALCGWPWWAALPAGLAITFALSLVLWEVRFLDISYQGVREVHWRAWRSASASSVLWHEIRELVLVHKEITNFEGDKVLLASVGWNPKPGAKVLMYKDGTSSVAAEDVQGHLVMLRSSRWRTYGLRDLDLLRLLKTRQAHCTSRPPSTGFPAPAP